MLFTPQLLPNFYAGQQVIHYFLSRSNTGVYKVTILTIGLFLITVKALFCNIQNPKMPFSKHLPSETEGKLKCYNNCTICYQHNRHFRHAPGKNRQKQGGFTGVVLMAQVIEIAAVSTDKQIPKPYTPPFPIRFLPDSEVRVFVFFPSFT